MSSAPPESFDHEFPRIPEGFDKFEIVPSDKIKVNEKLWKCALTLRNRFKTGVLFKVKCNSNALVKIIDCADLLLPGNEVKVEMARTEANPETEVRITVFYCLVGNQWTKEKNANVFECWRRAKDQLVPLNSVHLPVLVEKSKMDVK